jgi:hypothetical protein
MATVNVLGVCPGGNHIRLRITLSGGQQFTREVERGELRNAPGMTVQECIHEGIVNAVKDANPTTLNQLRSALEGKIFPERIVGAV